MNMLFFLTWLPGAATTAGDSLADSIRAHLPGSLLDVGFLLENWQWGGLVALLFVSVVIDRIVRVAASVVAHRMTRLKEDQEHDRSIVLFRRPIGLWCGAFFFELSLGALDLAPGADGALSLAAELLMTVTGVWAFLGLADVVCDVLAEKAAKSANKFDDMLVPLLRRTLKILVLVIGLVYIASKWTDNLWNVVAGLGLGSVAIAFAARDSVENLFGTFTVLLDKPFEIGDWITMGDLDGSVESVGFRSTKVRTFYNSLVTVPNRHFISGQIDNMGRRRYRRIKTTLSLTYDTPPESVEAFCEGVRELIRKHPYTRKDYYHVYLNGLGASSLDVLLYCFVRTPDWSAELREKHRLFADILRLAKALEVEFAFPTQTLFVAKPEDLEHPDAPADIEGGLAAGRAAAEEVLEASLGAFGGGRPGPVVIGDSDPDGRLC